MSVRLPAAALVLLVLAACTKSPWVSVVNESRFGVRGYVQIPAIGGFIYPPPAVRVFFTAPPGSRVMHLRRGSQHRSVSDWSHTVYIALDTGNGWLVASVPYDRPHVVFTITGDPPDHAIAAQGEALPVDHYATEEEMNEAIGKLRG